VADPSILTPYHLFPTFAEYSS